MNRLWALCLIAGIGISAVEQQHSWADTASAEEPTYKDIPLSEWVKRSLNKNPRARKKAQAALRELSYWGVADAAVAPLTEALKDKDAQVRVRASEALWVLNRGPKAEAKVADLITKLKDKDLVVRQLATRDLQFYDPAAKAAVPALTKALQDTSPDVRSEAAMTLGLLGAEVKGVVPILVAVLRARPTPFDFREITAAAALGRLGPAAREAVPALIEALTDHEDTVVQAPAALALARIGCPAKAALPALRTALRDKSWEVRARAAIALWRIDGNVNEAMPVFVATLKRRKGNRPGDSNAWMVQQVVRALGEMGPQAKKAVPALLPLLKDKNEGLRWWARQALKKIDASAAKKLGRPDVAPPGG